MSTISNNYGDSFMYNSSLSAAATPKESSELSGYLEAMWMIMFSGDMGTQKTSGTPTASQNFMLTQFMSLVNSPNFLTDLKSSVTPLGQQLYQLLAVDTDPSGKTIVNYCQDTSGAGLTALGQMVSESDGSLFTLIGMKLSAGANWTNYLSYTPSAGVTGTASLPNDLKTLMSSIQSMYNALNATPPDMGTAELFATNMISPMMDKINAIIAANPNDGYSIMLKNFLNSNYGTSTVSFASLVAEIKAAGGDSSKLDPILINTTNSSDPTTMFNLLWNRGQDDNNFLYYFGVLSNDIEKYT